MQLERTGLLPVLMRSLTANDLFVRSICGSPAKSNTKSGSSFASSAGSCFFKDFEDFDVEGIGRTSSASESIVMT